MGKGRKKPKKRAPKGAKRPAGKPKKRAKRKARKAQKTARPASRSGKKKRPAGTEPLRGVSSALPVRTVRAGILPGAPLGVSSELFPPEEIERLRLTVLTSARREEKVEALRRLAYSPLGPEAKAEIFLGRLADPDAEIRVEAAQLLRTLGLDTELAEAVRDLERGDEPKKLFAIDRIGRRMARGGPLDVGAGLIALVWRLREESSPAVRRQLLDRLEEAHEVIVGAPGRAVELVRLLVSLFASDPVEIGPPARRLVRRLGEHLPDRIREILWSEYDGTSDRQVRVFVLQLVSGLPAFEADERLPPALADEVARGEEREIGFRLLGDVLMQLEDRGVRALLGVFARARVSQQRYIVRLVADACRFGRMSSETKEGIAELFLALLAGHQREVQMAVLSTQLLADLDLAEQTRTRLAEAYLAHVNLFIFPADVDNVEHTISRGGLAAVGPIVERLGPGNPSTERARAARILGELALAQSQPAPSSKGAPRTSASPVKPGGSELRKALLDILRTLQRWSLEPDFPDTAAVLTAMGKVTSAPVIPADTVEIIARNLLRRGTEAPEDRPETGGTEEEGLEEERGPEEGGAEETKPGVAQEAGPEGSGQPAGETADEAKEPPGFDYRALEALGYLAASPHVSASRVDEIESIFRGQLVADLPEITAEESEEDGVSVFAIGSEAEVYTDAVPAAVRGLARVALGKPSDGDRITGVVDFLLSSWEKATLGELEWGPPGATALVEALADIACGRRVDVSQKVRVVRALARRLGQIPVIEALGRIFSSEDRSVDLGKMAAAAGVALIRRKGEDGQFGEDERESILRTLSRIAMRAALDVSTAITVRLRENIMEELFAGLRDGIQGCYEALARLRANDALPRGFRDAVSQRLSAYESLVVV